jgi:hypothetical protein
MLSLPFAVRFLVVKKPRLLKRLQAPSVKTSTTPLGV